MLLELEYLWNMMSGEGEVGQHLIEPHPNGTDDIHTFIAADWQGIKAVFHIDKPLYIPLEEGSFVSSYRFVSAYPLDRLEVVVAAPKGTVGTGKDVEFVDMDDEGSARYVVQLARLRQDQEVNAEIMFVDEAAQSAPRAATAVRPGKASFMHQFPPALIVGAACVGVLLLVALVVLFIIATKSRTATQDTDDAQNDEVKSV
jgi:hypothetical protein